MPPPSPGPRPEPRPGPTPVPLPVPAPPPSPLPCEGTPGVGTFDTIPGISTTPVAVCMAGISIFGGGGGSALATSALGFSTGTVTFSAPFNSALRGGSGLLLPPPPPPPPGPGRSSQTMSRGSGSVTLAGGGVGGLAIATRTRSTNAAWTRNDASVAFPARFTWIPPEETSPARNRAFGLAPVFGSWLIVSTCCRGSETAAILDVSATIRKPATKMPHLYAGQKGGAIRPSQALDADSYRMDVPTGR